jgi:hypothetical protein
VCQSAKTGVVRLCWITLSSFCAYGKFADSFFAEMTIDKPSTIYIQGSFDPGIAIAQIPPAGEMKSICKEDGNELGNHLSAEQGQWRAVSRGYVAVSELEMAEEYLATAKTARYSHYREE